MVLRNDLRTAVSGRHSNGPNFLETRTLESVPDVCPGCGRIVSSPFEPSRVAQDAAMHELDDGQLDDGFVSMDVVPSRVDRDAATRELDDVGKIKWQPLPDGRYLGVVTIVVMQHNVIHECA